MSQSTTQITGASGAPGERVPPGSVLAPFISVDAARMAGQPCFKGSRVPIRMLFEHLRLGSSIDEFVTDFPPVTREQASAVLELAQMGMLEGLRNL